MHLAGRPSWRMSESSRPDILFALYVREAAGIGKLGLPDLSPGIPRLGTTGDADLLTAQWGRWWASVIEPELVVPSGPLDLVPGTTHTVMVPATGAEQLREVLEQLAEPATEWSWAAKRAMGHREITRARRGGLEVTHLVNGFADELGRPVHPFSLDVEVLPTVEPGLWWIGQQTIAVSVDLRDDPEAYVAALRPVVASLA